MAELDKTAAIVRWSLKSHTETKDKIHTAMSIIEREIAENGGRYPGRLSISEVCRRAKIGRPTLEKRTHKNSTLIDVKQWLKKVTKELPEDANRRSRGKGRASIYKSRLDAVCQQYHERELELIGARQRIASLEEQIRTLNENQGKIIPLHGRRS